MLRDGIRQRRRGETRAALSEVLSQFPSEVISRVPEKRRLKKIKIHFKKTPTTQRATTESRHRRRSSERCGIIFRSLKKRGGEKKDTKVTKSADYLERREKNVWTEFSFSQSDTDVCLRDDRTGPNQTNRFKTPSNQNFMKTMAKFIRILRVNLDIIAGDSTRLFVLI